MSLAGERLRKCRLEQGLTQAALADRVACSKAHLSLMESGQRTISIEWARRLEAALDIDDDRLTEAVHWQAMTPEVRRRMQRQEAMVAELRRIVASPEVDHVSALRELVQECETNVSTPFALPRQIPVINRVAAGYPAEFTDLGYPVPVADEYVSCPEIRDPGAFAARVVGDSMLPEYREGEIVVFAPDQPTPAGSDCFVRFETHAASTFVRIYPEAGGRRIRLQPLNNIYSPTVVEAEAIAAMDAAVYVFRRVGAG